MQDGLELVFVMQDGLVWLVINEFVPWGNDILGAMPGFDENSNLGLPGYGNEVAQVQAITLFDAQDNNHKIQILCNSIHLQDE
jgi:hypothetical protein